MNDKTHDSFPEQALDDLLKQATSPPENPWFATQVLHRIHAEESKKNTFISFFSWRRLVWGTGGIFSLCAVIIFLFLMPSPSTNSDSTAITHSTEIFMISDEEIVSELEIYISAYQTDLWLTENSSL